MNIDDPKLTAFALDELDEPERSTIARMVAESREAQLYVDETRELAGALKQYFAESPMEGQAAASPQKAGPQSSAAPADRGAKLINIQDDPWLWTKARPLALAATIALCAIVIAIAVAKYRTSHGSPRSDAWAVEMESDLPLPDTMPNPLTPDSVRKIDHIVVAEVINPQPGGEVHQIEVIRDAYRISKMQDRLSMPTLSRNRDGRLSSRIYQLVCFDRDGGKVITAYFYRTGGGTFVLQLLQPAEAPVGSHLSKYVLPFNDWVDSIGYAPGA